MLTLALVAFPIILLLGVLGAARLERYIDRQPRRRPVVTPVVAEEPAAGNLATVSPIAR